MSKALVAVYVCGWGFALSWLPALTGWRPAQLAYEVSLGGLLLCTLVFLLVPRSRP